MTLTEGLGAVFDVVRQITLAPGDRFACFRIHSAAAKETP
jgi:hypothetical protein